MVLWRTWLLFFILMTRGDGRTLWEWSTGPRGLQIAKWYTSVLRGISRHFICLGER